MYDVHVICLFFSTICLEVIPQLIIEAEPPKVDVVIKSTELPPLNLESIEGATNHSGRMEEPFNRYHNIPLGKSVLLECETFYKWKNDRKKAIASNESRMNSSLKNDSEEISMTDDIEVVWLLPPEHTMEVKEIDWGCGDKHFGAKEDDITFSQRLLSSGLTRFCVDKRTSASPDTGSSNDILNHPSYGLKITRVMSQDSGIYHCAVRVRPRRGQESKPNQTLVRGSTFSHFDVGSEMKSHEWHYGKVALNLSPFKGNVYGRLKARAILAGWLAGSAGVLALLLLGLYKYKHESDYDESRGHGDHVSSMASYYPEEGLSAGGQHGRRKRGEAIINNGSGGGGNIASHHHMPGSYQYFKYGGTDDKESGSASTVTKQPLGPATSTSASYTNFGYEMADLDPDHQLDSVARSTDFPDSQDKL